MVSPKKHNPTISQRVLPLRPIAGSTTRWRSRTPAVGVVDVACGTETLLAMPTPSLVRLATNFPARTAFIRPLFGADRGREGGGPGCAAACARPGPRGPALRPRLRPLARHARVVGPPRLPGADLPHATRRPSPGRPRPLARAQRRQLRLALRPGHGQRALGHAHRRA